jgi:hypothetical protein
MALKVTYASLDHRSGSTVFHMLMTVLNLVFLFMRSPLIPFWFCSSY